MTDYKAGQKRIRAWLTGYGIKLANVKDLGIRSDDGWDHYAWSMTVKNWRHTDAPIDRNDKTGYTFPFNQGMGHTERPTLVDIMSALLSDAACVVDRTFEEFAEDLGYDTDSRKAEKLYQTILDNNAKLLKLFRTTDLPGLLEKYEPLREAAGL